MKFFSTRKFLKRLLMGVSAFTIMIVVGIILVVKYRITPVLKELVKRETNGTYEAEFSSVSINIIQGRLVVKKASLKPVAPSHSTSFQATIPSLYFSIGSWNQLLFHQ